MTTNTNTRRSLREVFEAEHTRLKLERLYLTSDAGSTAASVEEFNNAEPKRTREEEADESTDGPNKKKVGVTGFRDLQVSTPSVAAPPVIPSLLSSITSAFTTGVGPSRPIAPASKFKNVVGGSERLGARQFVNTATISAEDQQRVALFMEQQEKRIKANLEKREQEDINGARFNLATWLEIVTSPDVFTFTTIKRMIEKHRDELPVFLSIISQMHKKAMLPFIYSTLDQQIVDQTIAFPLDDVRTFQANPQSSFSFADYRALNTLDKDYMKATLLANERFDIDPYHPWNDETPNSVKFMKSELGATIYHEALKHQRIEESILYASSISFRQLFAQDFFKQLLDLVPGVWSQLTPGYTDRLFINLFDDKTPSDRAIVQQSMEDENNLLFGHYIPYKGLRIIAWNPNAMKYENYVITEVPGFDDKLKEILVRYKRTADEGATKTPTPSSSGDGRVSKGLSYLSYLFSAPSDKPPALTPITSTTTTTTSTTSTPLSINLDSPAPASSVAHDQLLRDLAIQPEETGRFKPGDTAEKLNQSFYTVMATIRERWNQTGIPLATRVANAAKSAGKYAIYGLGLQVFARLFLNWLPIKTEIQEALLKIQSFKCVRYAITDAGGIDLSTEVFEARVLSDTPVSVPSYAPRQWVIQNRDVKENRMMVTRPGFVNEESIEVTEIERLTFVLSTSDNTNIRKGLVVTLLIVLDSDAAFFAPFAIIGGDYKTHIRLTYVGRINWDTERVKIRPVLYNYGVERGWAGHRMFRMVRFGVYFETHSKQPCHVLMTSAGNRGYIFQQQQQHDKSASDAPLMQTTTIVEMND